MCSYIVHTCIYEWTIYSERKEWKTDVDAVLPKLNDANDVSQTIVDGKPLCIFHRKLTHAHTHKYLRRSQCRRMYLHKPIEKGALVILHTHVTRYRAISPKEKETSI